MIVDFHTHAFPDALAERAVASLRKGVADSGLGFDDTAFTDGTAGGLIHIMDKGGVNRAVLLPVATKPSQAEGINRWTEPFLKDPQSRIIPFGAIYPDENYEKNLEAIAAAGYKGVKIHGDYQGFHADEPRMLDFYRKCGKLSLIIVVHAGIDPVSPEDIHVTPEAMARVFDRVSGVTIVMAHMGGIRCEEKACRMLAGAQGLFVDTSYCAGRISPAAMTDMIRAYGTDRVLFGSDCPWNDPVDDIALVNDTALSDREKDMVLSQNACKMLKI